jgi:putative membrane protein
VILRWLILALSVLVGAFVAQKLGLPFEIEEGAWLEFMLGVAVLSLLNATLGSILKLITLPLTCLTFGISALAINAVILMVAASLEWGFRIPGEGWDRFKTAFIGSLVISIVSSILRSILMKDEDKKSAKEDD